jgi:hypothetical protein
LPQQQAEYLAEAWQHIRLDWPWVQVATVWNLSQGIPPADEMAGYSLLSVDGNPKPAYRALADLLAGDGGDGSEAWVDRMMTNWRKAQPEEIPILAADEIVHLGDNQ